MDKMDGDEIRDSLRHLPLGKIKYFESITSTNDVCLDWSQEDVPDLSLVIANKQTAGRGRNTRTWYSEGDSGLAFSLLIRPEYTEMKDISLFSGLGALAVSNALENYGLDPRIKWPNDVLIRSRKVCGILVEGAWINERLESIVMGIGVNVRANSIPPAETLNFPATCLETEISQTVNRLQLLREIISNIIVWRPRIYEDDFLHAWEDRLAFRDTMVEIWADNFPSRIGKIAGLEKDGSLKLLTAKGKSICAHFGEVHLHPVL